MRYTDLSQAWKFKTNNDVLYLQMQKEENECWKWELFDKDFTSVYSGEYRDVPDIDEARYRIIHDVLPAPIEDFIIRAEETDFGCARLNFLVEQKNKGTSTESLLQTIDELLEQNEELHEKILILENELEERDMQEDYNYECEIGWDI